MYIKILVYIIDNQQFKLKISILFFGSLVIFRSHLPPFVDWGDGAKNGSTAGPISGRWSVPHIPAYPRISLHVRRPNISHLSSPNDFLINFITFAI